MTSFRGESLARDPKAFTYGIEVNPNIACSVKTIPLSRRDKSQPVSRSARSESLVEVGNEIVGILDTERKANETISDTCLLPFLARQHDVRRDTGDRRQRFDPPQARRDSDESERIRDTLRFVEPTVHLEAHDPAAAAHLSAGECMLRERLEHRVVDGSHFFVPLEEARHGEAVFVVTLDTQTEGLHAADEQIRCVRVEDTSKHAHERFDAVDELRRARDDACEKIRVPA